MVHWIMANSSSQIVHSSWQIVHSAEANPTMIYDP